MPTEELFGNWAAAKVEGATGWFDETWAPGISLVWGWDGYQYRYIPTYDAQLLVMTSGPMAGMLVRLIGENLSIAGDFSSPNPTPYTGTITGFTIYDRYEDLLIFDDPNDQVLTYEGYLWDGELRAEVSGLSIDAASLIGVSDLAGTLFAAVTGGDDVITGSSYDDTIDRGDGADQINAAKGNDTIDAGAGDDVVQGGKGDDKMNGVGGNDILKGHDGNDTINGGGHDDLIYGGRDDDTLIGVNGNDTIFGDAGDDDLRGGNGNDTLRGGKGLDTIDGGAGDDKLIGNDDSDILIGGFGADILKGGAAGDIFVFADVADSTAASTDRVADFKSGKDKIDLKSIDADIFTAGDQAFTFIGGAGFSGLAGELRYHVAKAKLYADVDGDATADLVIFLQGAPAVGAGDFIL